MKRTGDAFKILLIVGVVFLAGCIAAVPREQVPTGPDTGG